MIASITPRKLRGAVAMGTRLIARAAVDKGLCPAECLTALEALLRAHDLPLHTDCTAETLRDLALSDKKRKGGKLTLVVPVKYGESDLRTVPVDELIHWARAGLKP